MNKEKLLNISTKAAYEAYAKAVNSTAMDGSTMKSFANLPQQVRQAWEKATEESIRLFILQVFMEKEEYDLGIHWEHNQLVEFLKENETA